MHLAVCNAQRARPAIRRQLLWESSLLQKGNIELAAYNYNCVVCPLSPPLASQFNKAVGNCTASAMGERQQTCQ